MKIARKIRTRLYSSRNAKNRRRSESELGRGTTFASLAARRTWKLSDITNSEFSEKRAGHWAGLREFRLSTESLKGRPAASFHEPLHAISSSGNAKLRVRCSEKSSRGTSAMIAPLRITIMRSVMPSSSGNSLDTTMTAHPRSAN
jgi:hypothetical protein